VIGLSAMLLLLGLSGAYTLVPDLGGLLEGRFYGPRPCSLIHRPARRRRRLDGAFYSGVLERLGWVSRKGASRAEHARSTRGRRRLLWVDAVEKSKIERHRKSRESRFFGTAAAARYSAANTKAGGRFRIDRCGSSGRRARSASAALENFVWYP
jgi:hypothetical protein